MKNLILLSIFALALVACDLELQTPYAFKEGVPELTTFETQTAMDFIESKLTVQGTPANGNNLDSLYRAIKLAGLEEEYRKLDGQRTYLFLVNSAWANTGGGKITRDLGNVRNIALINKERLTNLLKYHIIEAYVDQREALPDWRQFYYFQTLIPGDVGVISFTRNERYSLTINNGPNIPANTRKSSGVYRHNYILKNGMGHFMSNYVRYQQF